MGKYYSFKHDYEVEPVSKDNFIKVLKKIGQEDPAEVIVTKIGGKKPAPGTQLTDREYIGRGVLNVRKKLNGHLGLSGKYTNRMILLSSKIKKIKSEDGPIWLKAKLPKNDYKKIVETTYKLLRECDRKYCAKLLSDEKEDRYIQQRFHKAPQYRTVAPIQTNMIIRTTAGKTEQITAFADEFRAYILRFK